jgi:hypothetical protein
MHPNGSQLGEVADFERQMFDLAQMFIRTPKLYLSDKTAILPNCCYKKCRLLRINFNLKTK